MKNIKTLLPLLLFIFWNSACERKLTLQGLLSDDVKIRQKAVLSLQKKPIEVKKVFAQELVAAFSDENSLRVDRAIKALESVGNEAIPPLKTALLNADPYIKLSALTAIGNMGENAKPALPNVVELIKDTHPLVREEVLLTIAKIDGQSSDVISSFQFALKDKSPIVRETAKRLLAEKK
jgi:HEAT repeat protein